MKVALLSDCYPPRLGGIEVAVRDLAVHLSRAGHTVEVFTATQGPPTDADGVQVHRLALPLPGGIPVNPLARGPVRRALQDGGFDVAHAHLGVISPFATDLLDIAVDLGVPAAATVHSMIERGSGWLRLRGRHRRWADHGVAFSAVSTAAAERLRAVAGTIEVDVIGNGIDASCWRPGPSDNTERDREAPVRIVTATRLATRKRPLKTLEVLSAARDVVPPDIEMRATVYGDGLLAPRLRRWCEHRGASWIDLPGRVDRDALAAAYRVSDLYLSTTRLEAFGIAALEARTAGLPVVAPAHSGVADFITSGVDGYLGTSDADLARGLADLVVDGPRRREMSRRLLATEPEQSWPNVVELTEGLYRRAVQARRR